MTTEELLLALKDIQPPTPPAWWQLAPIWWFIFAILLLTLGAYLFLKRRRKKRQLADLAVRELEAIVNCYRSQADKQALLLALANWLKRVAILAYPEDRLEAFNGRAWLKFLDQCQGDESFSRGPGIIFGDMVYHRQPDYDSAEVIQLCRGWMTAVSPVLLQQGQV